MQLGTHTCNVYPFSNDAVVGGLEFFVANCYRQFRGAERANRVDVNDELPTSDRVRLAN